MADMRLPYVRTAMAGMGSDPNHEKPVDIVGAAGKCSTTSIDLWKTAYGLDKPAYHRLRTAIIKEFSQRYPREQLAERIVEQAIHEFAGPGCAECTGTGKVGALELDAPQADCPACNGTKIRRYSDTTRAAMMHCSFGKTKHLAHKIGWVIRLLSNKDIVANIIMNIQMERR